MSKKNPFQYERLCTKTRFEGISTSIFLKIIFKRFRAIHNTGGSAKGLMLPKVRTETARKSFYFNGSKLFNDIPDELKAGFVRVLENLESPGILLWYFWKKTTGPGKSWKSVKLN